MNYFLNIINSLLSLVSGHLVTLKYFFKKPVTIQYPKERRYIYPRFRGRLKLNKDEKTGKPKCTSCLLCEKICPNRSIAISYDKDEKNRRLLKEFIIDFSTCLFCGLCTEVCPFTAISHTNEFEYGEYDRSKLIYNKNQLLGDSEK